MMNPFELLKNMDTIKAQAGQMKEKVEALRATGYAMGNMIEVVVTGKLEVQSIKIDPSLLSEENRQMVEVLTASAVNNAFSNLKNLIASQYGQLGQQMGLTL